MQYREPSRAVVGLGVGRVWLHGVWVLSIAPPPSQQKHPDFPKKPLTPYFRFFMEKRAKYAKLHPEMSNLDLTKILSKKYKELPEKKKVRVGVGGVGGGRLLVPLQLSQHNRHGSAPAWLRCHPALLQPRRTCWPCAASQGCGVGVEVEVTSVRPPLPDSAGRWRCRGVGRAGIAAALWQCRPAVLALGRAPRVGLSPAAKGPGCKVLRAARPRPAPRQGCPRDGAGGGDAFLPPGLGRRVWEQRRGCSPIGAVGPAQLAGSALPVPRADVPLCLLVVPR